MCRGPTSLPNKLLYYLYYGVPSGIPYYLVSIIIDFERRPNLADNQLVIFLFLVGVTTTTVLEAQHHKRPDKC